MVMDGTYIPCKMNSMKKCNWPRSLISNSCSRLQSTRWPCPHCLPKWWDRLHIWLQSQCSGKFAKHTTHYPHDSSLSLYSQKICACICTMLIRIPPMCKAISTICIRCSFCFFPQIPSVALNRFPRPILLRYEKRWIKLFPICFYLYV